MDRTWILSLIAETFRGYRKGLSAYFEKKAESISTYHEGLDNSALRFELLEQLESQRTDAFHLAYIPLGPDSPGIEEAPEANSSYNQAKICW